MINIKFHIIQPTDLETIKLIADWYLKQWNIPTEITVKRLQTITADKEQFQVLMTIDSTPVSTGGLYNHVGLLDKEPRLKIYKKWLALIYTTPDKRSKGYGALICKFIQDHAKNLGLTKIHLFTDTAERLYTRLGWTEVEKITVSDRNIVIMTKDLLP
jgi:GNAT superfamily N-acetyltransferase